MLGRGSGAIDGARDVSALEVGWKGGRAGEDDKATGLANLDSLKPCAFH
jgi:hypothetical protein